jgi:murein L,D-transpeptidase YafK
MRDLVRVEKNRNKKLRGTRKRKEDQIAANTTGQDFHIDTSDSRFAAVLEGTDDRFGIDKTDPAFKETPAMREILEQQKKRRKKKKSQAVSEAVTDIDADKMESTHVESSGALALSSLVKSLKSKVNKGTNQ